MHRDAFSALTRERMALERGRTDKQAPFLVGLAFPCTYRVGMSSLGALSIYRAIQSEPGMACERLFLPDDAGTGPLGTPPRSYERHRPLDEFSVVALPVAYELELAGVVQLLEAAGLPALREARSGRHPLVLAGGALTFANPLPLLPFVDVVVMGEADTLALEVLRLVRDSAGRESALAALARLPHVWVPAHQGATLPPLARCPDELLPAWSPIQTPDCGLGDMLLVEAARGCARSCSYCVMRRAADSGMRLVPRARILERVPAAASRVGLVGAAVSDHPEIVAVVRELAQRGSQVGLSSLRPDRLDDELVSALAAAGYRTLTTALDGASDRVRARIDRRVRAEHVVRAAELGRQHHMKKLKLYLMLGAPGETAEDVDECARLVLELSRVMPVALSVSAFCAKRNTPLEAEPFAGIEVVSRRLGRLRAALRGRAVVGSTSVRWAWVEHQLAQGASAEGLAVLDAVHQGGTFAAFRRALECRARAIGGVE
jgi:radical SAM superfamily enzyme YgiQ (UPF0313 family)